MGVKYSDYYKNPIKDEEKPKRRKNMKKTIIRTAMIITALTLAYKIGYTGGQFDAGVTQVHKEYFGGKLKVDIQKGMDAK